MSQQEKKQGSGGRVNLPPYPNIAYHPAFAENGFPYGIEINIFACGDLMQRKLGISRKNITSFQVLVSTDKITSLDPINQSSLDGERKTLTIFPTNIWNKQNRLSSNITLLTTGSSYELQIEDTSHNSEGYHIFISRRHQELDKDGRDRKRVENEIATDLKRVMGVKKSQSFFEELSNKKQDSKQISERLMEISRRALTESLTYGLYKSLYPNFAERFALRYGSKVLMGLALVRILSLTDSFKDTSIIYPALTAYWFILLQDFLNKNIPRGLYKFEDFRARKFARNISNDPEWNNLVTLGKGWE